jgi:hypothetical protein
MAGPIAITAVRENSCKKSSKVISTKNCITILEAI